MADSKANQLQIKKLFGNNIEDILFTINGLRNTGNTQILPHLIKLLNQNKNTKVRKALTDFFNDIKSQEAVNEIVTALKNNEYLEIHNILLSACWQSGLDFSNYIDVFIDIFIKGSYLEAIEAFTVIENIDKNVNGEIIESSISKLKSEITSFEADKKELMVELVHVLKRM
ncbi:MAG: hypothetical protein JXR51_03475 [Bacteroidales bacterium]|nr:hypothetical protein [Bacteroidales bacterium]MBN2756213.1 hypothetical protein [Bacteroidales bacterium]